tara:strand:+ start:13949 stop:14935 length:987 start_codon:yes stop_codon:yes gene_type:complete
MGRKQRLEKQENIERANRLLESRRERGLMTEQPGFDPEYDKMDAMAAGCLNPLLGGYDPSATVDCSGNPQPPTGYGDESCCGMPGPQEYVCMGGVVGPGGTNSCTGPHPAGAYQMGDPNVMGIYPTQAACDVACNGIICDPPPNGCPPGEIWMPAPICACQTDPNTGTACDISWNTPCAQQHLLTGAQNSWTTFLNQRQTGWDNVGCQHLQNVVNWTTDQLNSGVTGNGTPLNPTQIARKTEKRDWAQCQGSQCGCTINMPPLTGGNTPIGPPNEPENPDLIDPEAPIKTKTKSKDEKKPPTKDETSDKKDKLNEEVNKMKKLWNYNK